MFVLVHGFSFFALLLLLLSWIMVSVGWVLGDWFYWVGLGWVLLFLYGGCWAFGLVRFRLLKFCCLCVLGGG